MSNKWVTIATFENAAEAHAVKNCLETEGLSAVITDEGVGGWLNVLRMAAAEGQLRSG